MKKTAHYRRALWVDGLDNVLSTVLEAALSEVGDDVMPVFDISDGMKCMIARRTIASNARYLHLVTYEEGAPVAVINTQIQAAAVDASEQDPEGENEYIHSQIFCLLRDNHILWATHNQPLREGSIQDILARFIESRGGPHDSTQFFFQVVLDQAVVQNAFEDGIEELDLGIGAFNATLQRIANGGVLPSDGFLSKLTNIMTGPATQEQIDAASNIEGKLILKPGRDWKKPEVKSLMTTLSNNIRNSYEDEFAIVTKNGLRLTRDKMSLKRECDVQGNRRVLSSTQMEMQLRSTLSLFYELDIVND